MRRQDNLKNRNNSIVYTRTEKNEEPSGFGWLKKFAFIAFTIIFFYLIFFSGILMIRDIEVLGYSHPETVHALVVEEGERLVIKNNILLFRTRRFRDTLFGDLNIKNIRVEKLFPSKIRIIIEENQPELIWISGGESYLIDGGGVVIGLAEDEVLTEVFDISNIQVKRGDRVASPTFINFINVISKDFEATVGPKINKIIVYDILNDIHISTSDGWTAYLNANKDPEAQMENLTRVYNEARKTTSKLQYIDLRLHSKAFYK